jgi:hypothetical protein
LKLKESKGQSERGMIEDDDDIEKCKTFRRKQATYNNRGKNTR